MATIAWRGDAFRRQIEDEVAARLENAGAAGVQAARELVPVETGRTRDSIAATFDRATLTLQIHADTKWAIFIELGTSRMAARPFLRPALAAVGRAFGGGINTGMSFKSQPAHAHSHGSPEQGRNVRIRAKLRRSRSG